MNLIRRDRTMRTLGKNDSNDNNDHRVASNKNNIARTITMTIVITMIIIIRL